MAGALALTATVEFPDVEKRKVEEKRLRKIPGGRATLAKIQLVSNNYMGRIRVSGKGIPLKVSGESYGDSRWQLTFAAAEAHCDIVLNVITYDNGEGVYVSEGMAYRKS